MYESEFPPNKHEIWARLTPPYVDLLDLASLTCDEAAQVISGIDGNGFNQADADDFEHICLLINRGIIAKSIPSIERDGRAYVKTLDVVKWAIAWAETKEYELPPYVLNWFEKQNTTLAKLGTYEERDRDFLIWINEMGGKPKVESMKKADIRENLIQRNSSLWQSGFVDWWKHQNIIKGNPGRKPGRKTG